MKTLLTFALSLLGFSGGLFAQGQAAQTAPAASDSTVLPPVAYVTVEKMPEFPGGIKGLNRFLSRNLKYPADARNAGVQGTVRVSFLVTPAGQIENPEIVEGLSHGCNEEVIRLVNLMPPWTPGRQDGKPVTVRYSMPFQFRMH